MPIAVTKTTGSGNYGNPFVGDVNQFGHIKVDVSALTSREVDANGYLKPGVPIALDGLLLGAANVKQFGVVFEPIKIHSDNTTLAGVTADPFIACALHGTINRDIAEDNMGAVYNANELSAFIGLASRFTLLLT